MAPSSEVVPFGATPAGVFDIACRVAESGGSLPVEITEAARAVAGELRSFPPDEVRAALERIITGPHADDGLQWLHEAGALEHVVPELDATVNFSQEAGRRHKDVWEHTKQVVMQSPAQPIVRWAALLHDIGKVGTRVMLSEGKVTFPPHRRCGAARLFETLARRLGFPRAERSVPIIVNTARQRLRAGMDRRSRAFASITKMGDALPEPWSSCHEPTSPSARPGRRQEAARNIEACLQRIAAVRELDARVPPLPPGVGNRHHGSLCHSALAPGG